MVASRAAKKVLPWVENLAAHSVDRKVAVSVRRTAVCWVDLTAACWVAKMAVYLAVLKADKSARSSAGLLGVNLVDRKAAWRESSMVGLWAGLTAAGLAKTRADRWDC